MPRLSPRSLIAWRVALQILTALCLLIGINYCAFRHYQHFDFSRSHWFSLSDQGSVLFSGIKQPAHITIYLSPTSLTEGSELYGDIEALMDEYQIKGRENLIIEYLDPVRNLGRAREIQAKYHLDPNENVIIINYLNHTAIIPVKELGDYRKSPSPSGGKEHLIAFRGEQVINAALIGLSGVPSKIVYFLQGHGEMTPGLPPLEIIGRYLERQNIKVALLNLAEKEQVPEDAGLIIIAGAHYDLSEKEKNALENYWTQSGRLFFLLDPTVSTPLFNQFLQEAGITPRTDRVLQSFPKEAGATIIRDVTGEFVPGSEITKQFLGLNIPLQGITQPLALLPSSNNLQCRPLIQAVYGFRGVQVMSQERDTSYSIIIAAMADRGALHDDRVAVKAARMVVVGNSDFIKDKNLNDIDLDFFSSALNGLIDRVQLTGNTAKMKAYFTLNLNEEELHRIALWTMLIIPAIAAFLGVILFGRRRGGAR